MKSNEFFCGVEKTVRDNAVALLVPLRGWLKPPAYSRLPAACSQTNSPLVRAVNSYHNKKPLHCEEVFYYGGP